MSSSHETAILAGGCFWGMQDLLRRYPGVISTRVGYSGGDVPNATYRNHGTHAEAIEIVFDPQKLTYRKLLEFFFQIHDPTTMNRQGNDRGTSYRSAIFYTTEEQKADRGRHHRRRQCLRNLARKSRDGSRAGRSLLASRARTSGLSRTLSKRLHLPLHPARLDPAPSCGLTEDGQYLRSVCRSKAVGNRTGAPRWQQRTPDFLLSLLALMTFTRLSLMKAAHVDVGGVSCRKSGYVGRKRWAQPFNRFS